MNMQAWNIGWGFLFTLLQCRFFMKMLGSKYRWTPFWFYLASLLYGQINIALALAVTSWGSFLYNGICAFVLNYILFRGSVIKKAFFTLWLYCAHAVVFSALFLPAHAAAIAGGRESCSDMVITGIGVAASLVQILMMEILEHKLHVLKNDFKNQDALYLMYIILFIYAAVEIITELYTGIRGWTKEEAVLTAGPCCLAVLCGAGLYVYCVVMLEQRLLKRSAEQQYQMLGQHLEASKEQYGRLERIQHDTKNHMLCLRRLLEDEKNIEAKHYLAQLYDQTYQGEARLQTGSVFADALLNPKYDKAKQLGIDISVSMTVPEEEEMASVDLCCLLANALDNAIEACQRNAGKDDSLGWIRMQSKLHKKYWVFEISNSNHVPAVIYKGSLLSSKRRQGCGVGLQNIRNIVERYDGVLELENGEYFTLSVLIPRSSGLLADRRKMAGPLAVKK